MGKSEMVLIPDVVFYQEGPGVRNTQYTTSGVKLLNVANLQDGKVDLSTSERYISEVEAYGKYKHFLVDDGDFIIASSGIQVDYFEKKMGFVDSTQLPLCMNTSTIRFKSLDENKLSICYFMYCLKTPQFKDQLRTLITGSAQLNFGPSHLKKMTIPLPPLEVQRQIADVLDSASALIEKRKAQIEKLDLLVKAQFIEMFGDPLTNPMGWEVRPLGKLGDFKNGINFRSSDAGYQVACLGVGDFKSLYTISDIGLLSKVNLAEELSSNYYLQDGDIVFVRSNGNKELVGRSVVIYPKTTPVTFSGFCIRFRKASADIDITYLNHLLHSSPARTRLLNDGRGANIQNLNQQMLSSQAIPLPPIAVQNDFTAFVKQVEIKKSLLQQSLEKLELNYKSLMQKCFNGEMF